MSHAGLVRTFHLAMLAASLFAASADATPVTYKISWTGSESLATHKNASMTGLFSFDSSRASTDVTAAELLSFSINIHTFYTSGSSATTDFAFVLNPAAMPSDFTFNFNAVMGAFRVGGSTGTNNYQNWNYTNGGISCATGTGGFISAAAQAGCSSRVVGQGYTAVNSRGVGSTLTATLVPQAVPEPGSMSLFGIAGIGLVSFTRRRSGRRSTPGR